LTLGEKGAIYFNTNEMYYENARAVKPVDTTAAGDTFIGFFLAELVHSGDRHKALAQGCRAAEICVTRSGAADSIPWRKELA
jgi:ribokinase